MPLQHTDSLQLAPRESATKSTIFLSFIYTKGISRLSCALPPTETQYFLFSLFFFIFNVYNNIVASFLYMTGFSEIQCRQTLQISQPFI